MAGCRAGLVASAAAARGAGCEAVAEARRWEEGPGGCSMGCGWAGHTRPAGAVAAEDRLLRDAAAEENLVAGTILYSRSPKREGTGPEDSCNHRQEGPRQGPARLEDPEEPVAGQGRPLYQAAPVGLLEGAEGQPQEEGLEQMLPRPEAVRVPALHQAVGSTAGYSTAEGHSSPGTAVVAAAAGSRLHTAAGTEHRSTDPKRPAGLQAGQGRLGVGKLFGPLPLGIRLVGSQYDT
mmetsp:Transcript_22383/g.62059  ORF Transcript_22383/g.62059 Transcript_22383/m.62059 type:complete len:235 (+) Transcript_22383:2121-2825(+)